MITKHRNYLYHHGIEGQKWGVRRYQNEDGSLTPAGRTRYGVAKEKYDKATRDANSAREEYNKNPRNLMSLNKLISANLEQRYARDDLKSSKILDKLDGRKVSNSTKKLREKYMKAGMSEDEAKVAAYNHQRTKRAVAIAAGIGIGVAAAYVAKKHYDETVDDILKEGSSLYRVAKQDTSDGVRDVFYAAGENKSDQKKYIGLYGNALKQSRFTEGDSVYQHKMGLGKELKIASPKNSRKTFNNIYSNDPEFKANVDDVIKKYSNQWSLPPNQRVLVNKAEKSVKTGKVKNEVYDVFNLAIPAMNRDPDSDMGKTAGKFYDALKSKGYAGIADINDRKYSGYNAKRPMILFDAKGAINSHDVRKLSDSEIDSNNKKELAKIRAAEYGKLIGQSAAIAGAGAAAYTGSERIATKLRNDKIVKAYKKKHPNTELSYNEIVRNYERSQMAGGVKR